jgi:PEP-CTERM motif
VAAADTVSGSGTWSSDAPTTNFSAPGGTWSFSFVLPNPVTDASPDDGGFDTFQFSDFTFFLNGNPVSDTLQVVTFFPSSELGLFDLGFPDITVSFFGGQAFGGTPPPIMTLVDGVFSADAALNDLTPAFGSGKITISSATAPEPATLTLLGLGIAAASFGRKIKAKKA